MLLASTCTKLSCSISQPTQSLSLSLSLSISVYLVHLIFHSGWKLQLHRQRCMWSFSLSAILGAKKIFSALLFAHFRFPLQLHVLRRATDPPPAHRYVLYMQQISRYAQNASCAALHCTVAVAVSSTEPGHAWELLTKQTAVARTEQAP